MAHSLPVLLSMVRSPGVLQTHIDALLDGIDRPLDEGETPRARADFLLSLIESPEVSHLQDEEGCTVRAAAVQALLGLGYPYALELPLEALADARSALEEPRKGRLSIPGLLASLIGSLTAAADVLELDKPLYVPDRSDWIVAGVLLGPVLLTVLGGLLRLRGLLALGVAAMGLLGSFALLLFCIAPWQANNFRFLVMALVVGLGLIPGSILLRPGAWLGEGESSKPRRLRRGQARLDTGS